MYLDIETIHNQHLINQVIDDVLNDIKVHRNTHKYIKLCDIIRIIDTYKHKYN